MDYKDQLDDYELSKSEINELEKERADANNASDILNAADVAVASGNTYAVAIGTAVKAADKFSGGKSTEALGKITTGANKIVPGGNLAQGMLNDLSESGAGDLAGKAARYKNMASGAKGGGSAADTAENAANTAENATNAAGKAAEGVGENAANKEGGLTPNQYKKPGQEGGEQNSSLPSSADKNNPNQQQNQQNQPKATNPDGTPKTEEQLKQEAQQQAEQKAKEEAEKEARTPKEVLADSAEAAADEPKGMANPFKLGFWQKTAIFAVLPFFIHIILFVMIIAFFGIFLNVEDAFGVDGAQGNSIDGIVFGATTKEQEDFYKRILEVKEDFANFGMDLDPVKVVATYSVLKSRGANLDYKKMTKLRITEFANCMFLWGEYSDETFKRNLIRYLIPKYLPKTTDAEREVIANDVFEYISNYQSLIGKDGNSCGGVGTCSYDIKGFYIDGSNRSKSMNVNNLYVRLMQCGKYNGHDAGGTFGQPLADEELVPFEKYILGVAYQEIGGSASEEAFKAQMISARSFILARPTQMGGWRTLKQEDGKWVIQVASCTADQVYCDPDKGCSAEGGDGQWKQVHSGTNHGRKLKDPLPADSKLRQWASEVQGETLVNNQGNIVLTDYTDVETKKFSSLANQGYDYKQIIMQVYSQKYPNAGISDINKANCGHCAATGEYTKWKQYEGEWVNVQLGDSGKTIKQIGCLATSVAIQIARSGVATNVDNFNPGTFVEYLSKNGGFYDGGNFAWESAEKIAPTFKYQGKVWLQGKSKSEKLNEIKKLTSQQGVYVVAEVKGNTGQHWVAIDTVEGDTVKMMDPGSTATDMWAEYNWENTSQLAYYKVG